MIRLLADSVASIPKQRAKDLGIDVVSLFIHDNGTEYVETEMDVEKFYTHLYEMLDDIPTSSQPSQKTFEDYFEAAAVAGDQVIAVLISSFMSGTHDGALRAARSVKERYPEFTCAIVDTRSTGFEESWPVLECAKYINEGRPFEECVKHAAETVFCSRYYFTPETLVFLQKGGRIGAAKALLGSLLQVLPVLTVVDGMPVDVAKVRTHKKARRAIEELLKKDLENNKLIELAVQFIGTPEGAREWSKTALEPLVGESLEVYPVSPVVGLHVGPAAGISYYCEKPVEGKCNCSVSELITYV